MRKVLLMLFAILLLSNTAFAIRLDGPNVKELVKQVQFNLSDVRYKVFDDVLGVYAQDIYIANGKVLRLEKKISAMTLCIIKIGKGLNMF